MASYEGTDQRGHICLLQVGAVTLQALDRKDLLLTRPTEMAGGVGHRPDCGGSDQSYYFDNDLNSELPSAVFTNPVGR